MPQEIRVESKTKLNGFIDLAVLNTTCSKDPNEGFCKDGSDFKFGIPKCGEEQFFRQAHPATIC